MFASNGPRKQDSTGLSNNLNVMAQSLEEELLTLKPIGHVQSLFSFKNGTPRQSGICQNARGSIKISKEIFNNPQHSLDGLETFSHIWIIFIFHKNNNSYIKAKVKPPRLDGRRVGLFSTRSPYRPNPVGLTLAKLDRVDGCKLHISGIDLLDGTPVLDIKPYIPDYDCPGVISTAAPSHLDKKDGEDDKNSDLSKSPHKRDLEVWRNTDMSSCPNKENEELGRNTDMSSCPNKEYVELGRNTDRSSCPNKEDVELGRNIDLSSCPNKEDIELGRNKDLTGYPSKEVPSLGRDTDLLSYPIKEVADLRCNINICSDSGDTPFYRTDSKCTTHVMQDDKASKDKRETNDIQVLESHTSKISNTRRNTDTVNDYVSKDDSQSVDSTKYNKDTATKSDVSNTEDTSKIKLADWISEPPTSKLTVRFTTNAERQLTAFTKDGQDPHFTLQYLCSTREAREAICSILCADPRSVYRRKHCRDQLYYFTVDVLHVTCWFDEEFVEVLRIKPVAMVEHCQTKK
ncbi:hypothetical protein FSP39_008283 [Pinctada imbricata]|uniref:TsaA-like domain-containing protein n=1 Tax=Pinctada imbricata TaxID=66713 RepID=A0AA88YCY3_PINIB|nr:hypothetical protein FSP39_008283 [Pinctada imbricata]